MVLSLSYWQLFPFTARRILVCFSSGLLLVVFFVVGGSFLPSSTVLRDAVRRRLASSSCLRRRFRLVKGLFFHCFLQGLCVFGVELASSVQGNKFFVVYTHTRTSRRVTVIMSQSRQPGLPAHCDDAIEGHSQLMSVIPTPPSSSGGGAVEATADCDKGGVSAVVVSGLPCPTGQPVTTSVQTSRTYPKTISLDQYRQRPRGAPLTVSSAGSGDTFAAGGSLTGVVPSVVPLSLHASHGVGVAGRMPPPPPPSIRPFNPSGFAQPMYPPLSSQAPTQNWNWPYGFSPDPYPHFPGMWQGQYAGAYYGAQGYPAGYPSQQASWATEAYPNAPSGPHPLPYTVTQAPASVASVQGLRSAPALGSELARSVPSSTRAPAGQDRGRRKHKRGRRRHTSSVVVYTDSEPARRMRASSPRRSSSVSSERTTCDDSSSEQSSPRSPSTSHGTPYRKRRRTDSSPPAGGSGSIPPFMSRRVLESNVGSDRTRLTSLSRLPPSAAPDYGRFSPKTSCSATVTRNDGVEMRNDFPSRLSPNEGWPSGAVTASPTVSVLSVGSACHQERVLLREDAAVDASTSKDTDRPQAPPKLGQTLVSALKLATIHTPSECAVVQLDQGPCQREQSSCQEQEFEVVGAPSAFVLPKAGIHTKNALVSKLFPKQQEPLASAKAVYRKKGTFFKAPSCSAIRPGGKRLAGKSILPEARLILTDAEAAMFATQEQSSALSKSAVTTLSATQLEEWEELGRQASEHVDLLEGLNSCIKKHLISSQVVDGTAVFSVNPDADPDFIRAICNATDSLLESQAYVCSALYCNTVLARRDAFFDRKLAKSVDRLRPEARVLPVDATSLFGASFAEKVQQTKERAYQDGALKQVYSGATSQRPGGKGKPSASTQGASTSTQPSSGAQGSQSGKGSKGKGKGSRPKQGGKRGGNSSASKSSAKKSI